MKEASEVPRQRRRPWWRLPALAAAVAVVGAIVGVVVASSIRIPTVEAMADYSPGLMTQVMDRNGESYRTYQRQRRALFEEGELPPLLRDTIVAAEDRNFYSHGGLDLLAIIRSSLIDLREGEKATGASTITMQLARNYFELSFEKRWRRKISEALLAVELEKRLSKDQILTLYANVINMGEVYGFKEASRHYFAKEPADLVPAEAATLAAIARRPADNRLSEVVLQRRDVILRRMQREGAIDAAELAAALATPLETTRSRRGSESGRYFAEEVRRHLIDTYGADSLYDRGLQAHTTLDLTMQRAAERAVLRGLSELDQRRSGWRGSTSNLVAEGTDLTQVELGSWPSTEPLPGVWYEGLVMDVDEKSATIRIADFTYTLDQRGIEWTRRDSPARLLGRGDVAWFELVAVDDEQQTPEDGQGELRLMLRQEPEMEAALVLIESSSGAVRALVGGWDFGRSEFNRATQARRQIGSAFKPFIYGAALEAGYTPADTLFDAPVVFRGAGNVENYSPRNFKRKYNGIVTLRWALEHSINVATAKLLDMVGVDRVIDFARRCGIESNLPRYPSLALGATELTPLELAGAYATLANQGVHVEPYMIERVTTRDGRLLEEHQPRTTEVVRPEIAYVITSMLRGVVLRGTATSAAGLDTEVVGKTGTTDSFTDAWFAGYTPRYTLLVWVGYDQNRFLGKNMTGAVVALPIWRQMVEAGLSQGWIKPRETFIRPPGVSTQRVEYRTGLLASSDAQRVIRETFIAGTEPVQVYEPRWEEILVLPWYQQRPFYGIAKAGERMPEDVDDWSVVRESWDIKDGLIDEEELQTEAPAHATPATL